MIFPYNTDAPIYYYPYATIGLIVVNVLMFIAAPPMEPAPISEEQVISRLNEIVEETGVDVAAMTEEEQEQFFYAHLDEIVDVYSDWRMLQFGNGLHPVQWLTANFMHADFMHLAVNMVYLWGLGLVVEGKLGWWKYLLVYLTIGIVGYALVQFMMLWANPGNALGASLPIFGILVIALLWAPLNELNCMVFLIRFATLFDITILWFAAGFLLLQVGVFLLGGMSMSSEALHLVGAFIGLPIGLGLLLTKLVDCENYDAISVWRGRHEMTRDERAQEHELAPQTQEKHAQKRATYLAQINAILQEQRDPTLAWSAHLKMQHRFNDWQLPEETYRALIKLYHEQGHKAESLPAMIECIRLHTLETTIDIRLVLAQYLIREGERPRQAQRVLEKLSAATLSEAQRAARQKLLAAAEQQAQVVELEEPLEEW